MNTENLGAFNLNIEMKKSRREFIKTASASVAGAVISRQLFADIAEQKSSAYPICTFTKCLQFLDYDRVGETLASVGFNGADLSVRNGGHVLPEKVETDLPRAVKALKKSGIITPMMVTGIVSPDDPLTERVLATASENGLTHYRMGYLMYNSQKSVSENLEEHKRTIEKLEKINRKYKIHGEYQNHSGTNVGGPVWDLHWVLKDCDPAYIGVQYDIRHAVVEGGVAWPLGMRLLAPWIKTTAIKDFIWLKEKNRWIIRNVLLGDGMVNFDAYMREYIKLGISGPVSIHYEYDLGGAELGNTKTTMKLEEIMGYMKKDLVWFRNKLKESGI
jgi:L-ribulose-5-phosphate 3-epimerase